MPVKCSQCGSICKDTSRFCDTCGGSLIVAAEGQKPTPAAVPARTEGAHYSPGLSEFFDKLWRIPLTIIFWAASAFACFISGPAIAAVIRGEDNPEALNFGVQFFVIAVVAVFLLTRVSYRTWFFYFGIFMGVLIVGMVISPGGDIQYDTYLFVVAAIGLALGFAGLKKTTFRPTGGAVWGRVTDIQPRQQTQAGMKGTIETWGFRLQETNPDFGALSRDSFANPTRALSVEIRAKEISGSLQNGDKVEVRGSRSKGTLYAKRVINHSTQSELILKGPAGIP
jgi:hypothetical protein